MKKINVFAGQLESAREGLKLTKCEFAELLGVSRGTIRNWSQNESRPFISLVATGLRAYRFMPALAQEVTGERLAQARLSSGLTQEDFGRLLGLSRPTLSRWENDTPPRWVSFALIALATKV